MKVFLLIFILFSFTMRGDIPKFRMITENWQPFNYEVRGVSAGISIDILNKILKGLGSSQTVDEVEFFPWARAFHVAQNNPSTILFSTSRTEAREDSFQWVGPIYLHKTEAFALRSREIVINSPEDFLNYTISTYLGDAQEEMIERELGVPISKLDRIPNADGRFLMVYHGRSDIFFSSRVSTTNFYRRNNLNPDLIESIYVLNSTGLYFALSPDIPSDIVEKMQEILDELHESGYIAELFKNYGIAWAYSI